MVLCDKQDNLQPMAVSNQPNNHHLQMQAPQQFQHPNHYQNSNHHNHHHHHHYHHVHHHHPPPPPSSHHHHHHPSHPHHHFSRSADIDHYDTYAMQNNFTIKRVESVARRLKVLENLEHLHEEEARNLSEKSHLYHESLANYQSLEASCATTTYTGTDEGAGSQISLGSGSSKKNLFTFSGTESDKMFASASLTTSLEAILEESNSPTNRMARNKIVTCLLTTGFSLYAVFSVIAPFYPQEAGHKGIPKSIFGLVFSVHALTIMLISPIIGTLLHRFEIKNLLTLGVLLTGCSMILFGFLHYLQDPVLFVLLSFVLRIFGAIGFAVFHTSANIYITKLYPHSIGTVFGLIETFCGFGLSFGPIIGGGLYEWSGFPMPFWVFGSLTLFNIILYYHLIKPLSEVVPEFEEQLSDDPDTPKLTYWKLLINFRVIVICFGTIIISQNQTFLDPTVEPHLYRHGVKESSVAMTFFLMNAAFAMLSPLVGLISLRVNKYTLMSLGLILSATGLLSLGPPWFIPKLRPDLQNSCLSMVAMGIAYSLTFVPSFEALLEHAVEKDKFENLQTYSLVAALYTAVFSLGEATGPAFGGIFTQYFSFQLSTIIMSCITYFAAFLMILTRFM